MFVHFENEIDTGIYEWEYKFDAWSLPQDNDRATIYSLIIKLLYMYIQFYYHYIYKSSGSFMYTIKDVITCLFRYWALNIAILLEEGSTDAVKWHTYSWETR